MRGSFLQRIFFTRGLIALFLILTLFFTYPTFFYNHLLVLLNAYRLPEGGQVYRLVSSTVYIFILITGILLIRSFPKHAINKEKTENLAAISFALQAFAIQTTIALMLQSHALWSSTYFHGGGLVLMEFRFISHLIITLILIVATLTLTTHHKSSKKLGQLASILTIIGYAGVIITNLLPWFQSFMFWLFYTDLGMSIVLIATSILSLQYLRKRARTPRDI